MNGGNATSYRMDGAVSACPKGTLTKSSGARLLAIRGNNPHLIRAALTIGGGCNNLEQSWNRAAYAHSYLGSRCSRA